MVSYTSLLLASLIDEVSPDHWIIFVCFDHDAKIENEIVLPILILAGTRFIYFG